MDANCTTGEEGQIKFRWLRGYFKRTESKEIKYAKFFITDILFDENDLYLRIWRVIVLKKQTIPSKYGIIIFIVYTEKY